jgi:hypothetical protein
LVLFDMPKIVVQGFQREGMESMYASVRGERLQAVLEIEQALRKFALAADNISNLTFQMGTLVRKAHAQITVDEVQAGVTFLKSMQGIVKDQSAAVQTAIKGGASSPFSYFALAVAGVAIGLEGRMMSLQQEAKQAGVSAKIEELLYNAALKLGQMRQESENIQDAHTAVQAALGKLDALEKQAAGAAARAAFADSDGVGHVFPVNTVMRRRYNTTRIRYENALKRAKKLAFVARRAIEFRLGVDMSRMDQELAPMPIR